MSQVSPFNALNELHKELGRMFDYRYGFSREPVTFSGTNWTPQIDIKESEKEFTVMADLPGVSPDDIDITLHNGVLTIKGKRSSDKEEEQNNYRRRERLRGSFIRQFTLPDSTDEEAIEAKAVHGVIEITIPKAAKPKPRKIAIN